MKRAGKVQASALPPIKSLCPAFGGLCGEGEIGLLLSFETVEKVPKRILGRDAEKNDLTGCATIKDLTIMKGHETPENHP